MMVSLIRCGQTVWDADGRLRGSTDLPLSDAGRVAVQADLSQSALGRPSLIHHPPDDAATETARLCAARMGAKIKSADGLADPNLGLLEGLTRQEFAERFHTRFKQWDEDPLSLSPPEGEDVVDAADRLFNTVARILKRSRSDEVALVLHDMGIGLMRCWLSDRPLTEMRAVLKDRPRIERYAVPTSLLSALEGAASTAHVRS